MKVGIVINKILRIERCQELVYVRPASAMYERMIASPTEVD